MSRRQALDRRPGEAELLDFLFFLLRRWRGHCVRYFFNRHVLFAHRERGGISILPDSFRNDLIRIR